MLLIWKNLRMRINNKPIKVNKFKGLMVAILTTVLLLSLMVTININASFAAETKKKSVKVEIPEIEADSAIVLSASTNEIVYSLHADRKLSPGSTVKLMNAMVVIDNMHDNKEFRNKVQITSDIVKAGETFPAGTSVSVEDLMYTMLMTDNNEAAEALAKYSAGSVSNFVDQMNAKAQQLGLVNTRYLNVSGAYDTEQYSTVEDTAKIAKAAYHYAPINRMATAERHNVRVIDGGSDKAIENSITMKSGDGAYAGFQAGVFNTMTEPEEHEVFLGSAIKKDLNLIVVLFDEKKGSSVKDAKALFDYGFKKANQKSIIAKDKKVGKVKIKHGAKTRLAVYTAGTGYVYIPPEGSDSLVKTETVIYDNIRAPLKAGDKVGEYRIYVADELTGTVDVIVKENVKEGWFPSYIYISNLTTIIIASFLFIFIYLIIRAIRIKRRKIKIRAKKRQEKIREMARKKLEIEEDRRRRNWTYR